MNIFQHLRRHPKAVVRYLLWRTGIRRYQTEIPVFLIKRHVPRAAVVLEAGAHDGRHTLELVRNLLPSKVYAFEPVPHLFERLEENVRTLPEVECFPVALASVDGKREMYVSGGESDSPSSSDLATDGSSSLLKPTRHLSEYPDIRFDRTIEVTVTTIDGFAHKRGIDRVDFMWLDMQGAELMALQGAEGLIEHVSCIYMEVSTEELYAGAPTYRQVQAWLASRGFAPKYEAIPKGGHGNVLFVRVSGGSTETCR